MPDDRDEISELLKSTYLFNTLTNDQVIDIADRMSSAAYRAGQIIFNTGDPADHLYFILQGVVHLRRENKNDEEDLGALSEGGIFGLEAVKPGQARRVTVTAAEDVTLVYLDARTLRVLQSVNAGFKSALKQMYSSYNLSLKVQLKWRHPDENVLFISRRSRYILGRRMITPFLLGFLAEIPLIYAFFYFFPNSMLAFYLAIAVAVIFLPIFLWHIVDWSNDYSIITNQRVLFQEKIILLYDSRQEAPLNSILSVKMQSSQLARWLNIGDVIVRTYAFSINLSDLVEPSRVVALLDAQIARVRSTRTKIDREAMARTLSRRMGIYIGNTNEAAIVDEQGQANEEEPAIEVDEGSLQRWLVNLFQMRWEKDGAITFRTHWYILLKRTWLPGLICLMAFIGMVVYLIAFFALLVPWITGLISAIFLISFIFWLYQYLDWRNDYYVITDDQVIDVNKKPLGFEERREAQVRNIQSIRFERLGVTGLMLNFGTVFVRIGEEELTFDNVYNPSEVQHELFKRVALNEQRYKQHESDAERQRLADYLEIYDHMRQQEDQDE